MRLTGVRPDGDHSSGEFRSSIPTHLPFQSGVPKEDKLVIQYLEVPADAANAQDLFKGESRL